MYVAPLLSVCAPGAFARKLSLAAGVARRVSDLDSHDFRLRFYSPAFFPPFPPYRRLGELFVGYPQIKRSLSPATTRSLEGEPADPIRFLRSWTGGAVTVEKPPKKSAPFVVTAA